MCFTQYIQNIVLSTCNQYKKLLQTFYACFHTKSSKTTSILYLLHISMQTSHISSAQQTCGQQLPYWTTYSQSSFLEYSMQKEVQQDSHSLKVSPHNRVTSYKGQNTHFTVWKSGRHPLSQRSKLASPVIGLMSSK